MSGGEPRRLPKCDQERSTTTMASTNRRQTAQEETPVVPDPEPMPAPSPEPETPEVPEPEVPSEGEETPGDPEDASKPERTNYRAETFCLHALQIITDAGDEGISLADLTAKLSVAVNWDGTIPYRTMHNVSWHLEGQPYPRHDERGQMQFGRLDHPEKRVAHRKTPTSLVYVAGPAWDSVDTPKPTSDKGVKLMPEDAKAVQDKAYSDAAKAKIQAQDDAKANAAA
jgi:hypothetical protein